VDFGGLTLGVTWGNMFAEYIVAAPLSRDPGAA